MMPRRREKRNKNVHPELGRFKRQKSECNDPEKQICQPFIPETTQKKANGRGNPKESVKWGLCPRTRMRAKNSAPPAGMIQDGGTKIATRYAYTYSLPPEKSYFPDNCTPRKIAPHTEHTQTGHKSLCHLSGVLRVNACTCTCTEDILLNGSDQSNESEQQRIRIPGQNEGTLQMNGHICGSPVSDITATQNGAFNFLTTVYSRSQANSQYGGHSFLRAHASSYQEQDRSSLSSSQRSTSSRKSDLETDDIDMDSIYPIAVQTDEEDFKKTPHRVPQDYADLSLERTDGSTGFLSYFKSRSKTTAVFIKHPLATDDPVLGDRFGASIETYKKQKDGYYRHVIRQVDVNGVAERMKISEGDEVVLLNGTFVPELDHEAVLKLFQEVSVDSHTRFALVLRRPLSRGTWEWVSTSAILIAELPNEPRVRDLKFSKDTGPQTFCHWYQLKVPGTNLFVIISEGQVRVEVATSENHKKYSICIRVKLSFDDKSGSYSYNACVFGMHHEERTRDIYLHVEDHGDVGLNERPQWFGYELLGSKMALKFHELNQYIGCQTSDFGQSGKLLLCANRDNALFERCPVAGSYDHTDSESDQMSEPSSLSSSRSSAYSFGNFCQPSNEPLSLELSDASSGSYESWSNSSQGDGGYHRNLRSRRSSRSRPESFEDPVSHTGSEYLSCSGSEYLSSETIINSCGTPNTPMANMRLSFCGEDKP